MRTGRGSGANCDESALCGIVLPPIDMNTPDYIGQLITCLSRIPIGAHTWIGGDFNLGDIDWETDKPYASK